MKNTVLFALTLLILTSCAQFKQAPQTNTSNKNTRQSDEKKALAVGKTRAVFHIVEPLGIQLVLVNVEEHTEEIVLMDKNLSQLYLKPGFWQITGFVLNGKKYKTMNTSKQFIFHLKKDKVTYAGTYIFQCPKVNQTHLNEMKKMNFFNRYPFANKAGLCELVVGSDFKNVKRIWTKVDKVEQRLIELGF